MSRFETRSPRKTVGKIRPLTGVILFASLLVATLWAVSLSWPHFFQIPTEVTVLFALKREGALGAIVLSATLLMALLERRSCWHFGLAGKRRGLNFVQGAITGMFFLCILIASLAVSHHLTLRGGTLHAARIFSQTPLWIVCFFIVALTEEILFRGYLQTTIARLIGFWPAAVVLSLSFGMVHLRNDGEAILGIIVVILGGALFSLALKRTGSLWWGIGFHTAWDWGQSFLFGTRDSGILIQDRLFQTMPLGSNFWSGGAIGPEGSAFVIPVFVLALGFVILRLRGHATGSAIAA